MATIKKPIKKYEDGGPIKKKFPTEGPNAPFPHGRQKGTPLDPSNNGSAKSGGSLSSLKSSNKREGPIDPKGAFTKVQTKTLAKSKGKATLTKNKPLGATKMAKSGSCVGCKKK